MNVEHFMTKDVVTVPPETKVTDAVDIMEENNFHRIPVVENGKFVGLVTEEVIAESSPSKVSSLSIYEMNYLFDRVLVEELMIKEVYTITPDVLIEEAATIMIDKDITVLPVLNEDKNVIGIMTHKDIFRALIDLTGYEGAGGRFIVDVEEDRVGVIAEITKALADNEISLTHIFVNRPDNKIEITVQTRDSSGERTRNVIESLGYKVREI